ncbi:tyrosine-tRNA ligase [Schizosaccharomyces cryophilus OY26]|uniref:Tyrosine--tRNA ligase n=1 Tax=Schizosaccharomyces cryophilus (strain OY26 / ATCC MYA-4695 / CBS 11777 / NBRC 106824 / NRRL Y48691) TaxID=653667 RepID=S9VZK9_SCHCR|nr:tyrosine-tRNA ligase [Schizosaccharomyces cryophilus OY26]EPY51250.1 tyrosine-tRNA ligase [Schizosaccharomyces cryophilus OY26]
MSRFLACWKQLTARSLVSNSTPFHSGWKVQGAYSGVDPTAGSLHVGNLVALMPLIHLYLHGIPVYSLIGDATVQLGDPSGRTTGRHQLDQVIRDRNSQAIEKQVFSLSEKVLAYAEDCQYKPEVAPASLRTWNIVHNLDWYNNMNLLNFLNEVGRHVRVNQMLARDSVTSRLHSSSGISFSELTYQLLQAYDFLHLYKNQGINLQIGGSDQWGNITAGTDLVRRLFPKAVSSKSPVYALTTPLLTTANGQKFGKSAGNAIWLDPSLTDSYSLYQSFISLPDDTASKYLDMLTLLSSENLESIKSSHSQDCSSRLIQHTLAFNIIHMVHGEENAKLARLQTELLHGSQPAPSGFFVASVNSTLPAVDQLKGIFKASNCYYKVDPSLSPMPLSRLLRELGIYASRKEAAEHIRSGAISLAHETILDPNAILVRNDLVVLRIGGRRALILDFT